MKKNILLKTNVFVCAIILVGFMITAFISYNSNVEIFAKDAEHVTNLASEGMYYQIDAIFNKPVHVSLTMANDSLLKEFLRDENTNEQDDAFIESMRTYLNGYREKYTYDSVFLVSTQTNRYYHFNGLDRVLTKGDEENTWYYQFLAQGQEYSINIDNDEAAHNEITVFINCAIKNQQEEIIGVVGVGFRIDSLQALLKEYEQNFDVRAYLIDEYGYAQIDSVNTGYDKHNFLAECDYAPMLRPLLSEEKQETAFWDTSGKRYVVTNYIDTLKWHLVVEKDTYAIDQQMHAQLSKAIVVTILIITCVLYIITTVIRRYNEKIIALTASKEREYYEIRQEASHVLYDNVYEVDITHDCAGSEVTMQYFESFGCPSTMPYHDVLKTISEQSVHAQYREGYLSMFSIEHVMEMYAQGEKTLRYEFISLLPNGEECWMRIMASIYYWSQDQSIRMLVYHQNIDGEKQQEQHLFEQMQKDSLTDLYNKAATQDLIQKELQLRRLAIYAFFIIDIDNFKNVNDTFGHAVGDEVIESFATILKAQFGNRDIVGRIGGDEFAVFFQSGNPMLIEEKAAHLVAKLHRSFKTTKGTCALSASIGVCISNREQLDFDTMYRNADEALYITKAKGKNGYTIYTAQESK